MGGAVPGIGAVQQFDRCDEEVAYRRRKSCSRYRGHERAARSAGRLAGLWGDTTNVEGQVVSVVQAPRGVRHGSPREIKFPQRVALREAAVDLLDLGLLLPARLHDGLEAELF